MSRCCVLDFSFLRFVAEYSNGIEFCRALLFGGMRESSQNQIVIKDSSVDAFKILLKYIYTGLITLHSLKVCFHLA